VIITKKKIKSGVEGDSLFVMNKALSLWGHEAVATRCPTGMAQPRKMNKDQPGYPKMTPEKVDAIRGKFVFLGFSKNRN